MNATHERTVRDNGWLNIPYTVRLKTQTDLAVSEEKIEKPFCSRSDVENFSSPFYNIELLKSLCFPFFSHNIEGFRPDCCPVHVSLTWPENVTVRLRELLFTCPAKSTVQLRTRKGPCLQSFKMAIIWTQSFRIALLT